MQHVGVDENIFELGGDSIRSMRIVALAEEAGISLTMEQLFELQTVEAVARAVLAP
jgi:aryl carrier-like protein